MRGQTHAAMARARHVAAEHVDAPLLDRARARDQGEQAGFADAVGADHPDHAAGRQIERDRTERPGLAVAQAHAVQLHHAADGSRCFGCGGRAHRVSLILRLSGHWRGRIELHIGHAGQAGLHMLDVLAQQIGRDMRLDAEHQLLAFLLGLDRLRA